jgi:predicted ATPase
MAGRVLQHFADGVWLADLAPLSDANLVPVTVASALGLELKATQVFGGRVAATLAASA